MKKIFTLLILLTITLTIWAQSPNKFSYQAVVRDADNNLVAEQTVGMQISILESSAAGTAVYTETHTPNTNANGLVTIEIGSGATSDDFSSIDWSAGPYFIMTEIDPAGGTNYTITSTSQLLSVPYAKYADKAGNIFSGSYNDLTEKPDLSEYATQSYIDNRTKKVAFSAYNSESDEFISSGNRKVEFDTEDFDYGDGFDNSEDRYVAPYDGVYHFSYSIAIYEPTDGSRYFTHINKNGSLYKVVSGLEIANSYSDIYFLTGSFTVELNAEDYIEIYQYSTDSDYSVYGISDRFTLFSGYLLFEK